MSVVAWLQDRNRMVEGVEEGTHLNPWQPRSKGRREEPGTGILPSGHAPKSGLTIFSATQPSRYESQPHPSMTFHRQENSGKHFRPKASQEEKNRYQNDQITY